MYDSLIQPIALRTTGLHEDAVVAVALASLLSCLEHQELPQWQPWLDSRFAKTVRRAKPTPFAERIAPHALSVVQVGEAAAAAFAPISYEDMAEQLPVVRKLQVAETNLERRGHNLVEHRSGPVFAVNDSLSMSTGKTAAQVAHALYLWFFTRSEKEQQEWMSEQSVSLFTDSISRSEFEQLAASSTVQVHDAGFTEIASGSMTVIDIPRAKG